MKHSRYIFSGLVLAAALGQGATALAEDGQTRQEEAAAGSYFQQRLGAEMGQGATATDSAQLEDTAPGEGDSPITTDPFSGFVSEPDPS